MALGSGLASSVGFAPEADYGAFTAPSRFLEVNKPALAKVKNVKQGGGLAAGRLVAPAARRVVTTRAASGSVETEVVDAKFGLLLAHIMGGTPAPVQQGTSGVYLQEHPLADDRGRSLTAQVGVPDLGGTVRPYTFLGSKITAAEFACGVGDILTCSMDLDCRDVVEDQALVAPSYPAGSSVFHFAQGSLLVGAHGQEVAVDGVRKVSLKITRKSKTDRFYLGGGGLKAEPLTNDMVTIGGSIETDFLDKAAFADRFRDDANASLVWEFAGAPIDGTATARTIRFRVPAAFFDTGTPQVDGPDVVAPSFTWVGLHDGVHPPVTIEYVSTDTAL